MQRIEGVSARWGIVAALVFGFSLSVACGDDGVGHGGDVVGGECRDDFDCAERCLSGDDFPRGTCSVSCRDDRDCPGGTYCVDEAGGTCLLACGAHADCRPGYVCDDTDRRGGGGDVFVCKDD